MNEVSESWNEDWTDWTAESWDDDDYWWNDQWLESCDGQWGVSQTWWDDGSGWYCDGYGYTWQQEPVQSAELSASHDNRSDVQKAGSVGSMIINPLLYDLTCETTGGLRLVHEHDLAVDSPSCGSRCGCNGAELELADMEAENRLVVECREFEAELADMGCVLVRGCDSCTHESELSESELADMGCVLARVCDSCTHEAGFSESEVADMGCVLARSCDSCTHEPWFCGLKFGDEVGLGDSSSLETRFVNDPSRDLCASVPMKIVLVRAHDWFDDHSEVSGPLLSQVADNTDASWWLLDSGASTSVLAESNLSAFRSVLQDSEGLGGYRAANGSSVNMSGTAEIGVQMHMSGPSGDDWCWKKARLNVLVGSILHNILSITSLADSGWRFTQGPKGFDLFHERLGMHCLDVAYFATIVLGFVCIQMLVVVVHIGLI